MVGVAGRAVNHRVVPVWFCGWTLWQFLASLNTKTKTKKEKGSGTNQLAFLCQITNRDVHVHIGCGVAKLDAAQLSSAS
jgi:hypothetical protein